MNDVQRSISYSRRWSSTLMRRSRRVRSAFNKQRAVHFGYAWPVTAWKWGEGICYPSDCQADGGVKSLRVLFPASWGVKWINERIYPQKPYCDSAPYLILFFLRSIVVQCLIKVWIVLCLVYVKSRFAAFCSQYPKRFARQALIFIVPIPLHYGFRSQWDNDFLIRVNQSGT